MKQVLEGSHAVSEAVRLAKTQVISAYPITPQTHIVEALSDYCANGTLPARFINVESEHSAMAALIGAATAGVRTFTATSSHGLAYMHELLHWASGARLPIVMANVNRALAPGWNIWVDQSDSLSQRDTGWIQLYCEDGQDVIDTTLQAFKLAEGVSLPVMVCLDAFFLSHTYEPIDVPVQEKVDSFLPPFVARFQIDTDSPCAIGQITPPAAYMAMRREHQRAMEKIPAKFGEIAAEFEAVFGRRYEPVEAIECEDAEIIMVVAGTAASTCRKVINDLRQNGESVGMLKIKMFRPFPADLIRRYLCRVNKVAVVDRNFSLGAGGIFAQEIRATLCNSKEHPPVFNFIAGLGGCDITVELLKQIYTRTKETPEPALESEWMGLD